MKMPLVPIAAALFLLLILFLFLSGKKNPDDLREHVTKEGGTEPAFKNEYWDEHRPGIYVDVNTGEPLFSSLDKFDSGTGWPSFTKAIDEEAVQTKEDTSFGMNRVEVRTEESHLGHLFDDGPGGSPRYCINSASLKFIPYAELEEEGYGEYKSRFPYKEAIFAGGCFWGVEHLFEETEGVVDAVSGYTGGDVEKPTYQQVSSGKTGHAEAVLVVYDPEKITYEELLGIFWRMHDPTQIDRQGPDVGTQYRSAVFYLDEGQKETALKSKEELDKRKVFDRPAATKIVPAGKFYNAEEYHQDYVDNHPGYVCHALRDE
jgi:peptide methionine sulfoxide reductase msrA/msrB